MRMVVFELTPQPVAVHLQHMALAKVVKSPQMLQRDVLRDHPPRVLCEIREDAVPVGVSETSRPPW